MKEIEVSAILEKSSLWDALAITPDGLCCYVFRRHHRRWVRMHPAIGTDLEYWNRRAYQYNKARRRVYRGIFTIKVADNG